MPGVLYTTTGFCSVDDDGVPPGKDQLYEDGLPEDVLLNCTVIEAQPVVGVAVKLAEGGGMSATVLVITVLPHGLVVVRVTV